MRAPPNNPEIEDFLLSALLIDSSEMARCVTAGLTMDAFYQPGNRMIYNRLSCMFSDGKPFDLAALFHEMTLGKEIEAVGGMPRLIEITARVPTTTNMAYYIEELQKLHAVRQIIAQSSQLLESCYNYKGQEVTELANRHLDQISRVVMNQAAQEETWDQVIDDALAEVEDMVSAEKPLTENQIPWPIEEMNRLFGPMRRSSLTLLGGYPSQGKSSLARQTTAGIIPLGMQVYFVTLEVKPMQVVLNMAQTATRVGIKDLNAKTHFRDIADFKAAIEDLRKAGIFMSKSERYVSQVIARAKALHARRPLDLVVVDHGRLLKDIAECRATELEQACSRVTALLKELAEELDCSVLLLWQLKRGEKNAEPRKEDLKGSGDIEANADKVILVHRPNTNPETQQEQDPHTHVDNLPVYYQHIIQAKGRDDGVATIAVDFVRRLATFREKADDQPREHQEDIGI